MNKPRHVLNMTQAFELFARELNPEEKELEATVMRLREKLLSRENELENLKVSYGLALKRLSRCEARWKKHLGEGEA